MVNGYGQNDHRRETQKVGKQTDGGGHAQMLKGLEDLSDANGDLPAHALP